MSETSDKKAAREWRAIHRFARVSQEKSLFVASLVRGLPVNRALDVLRLNPRRASFLIRKVLASAVANAAQDESGVNVNQLFVKKIWVDHAGLLQKRLRWRPGPMGRAMPIRRRMAHINVVVAAQAEKSEGREE